MWVIDRVGIDAGRLSAVIKDGGQSRAAIRTSYALPAGTGAASAAFYRGDLMPIFKGNLFIAAEMGRELVRLRFDPDNATKVVSVEQLLHDQIGAVRVVARGAGRCAVHRDGERAVPAGAVATSRRLRRQDMVKHLSLRESYFAASVPSAASCSRICFCASAAPSRVAGASVLRRIQSDPARIQARDPVIAPSSRPSGVMRRCSASASACRCARTRSKISTQISGTTPEMASTPPSAPAQSA